MDVDRLLGFLNQDPDNLSLLARVADALIEAGRAQEAGAYVERALQFAPANDEFLYRRAVVLRRTGEVAAARAQLSDLLARGVAAPAVRYELADLEFAERNFQVSAELLKALAPEDRRVLGNADLLLVRALHYLGLIAEAIQVAEAAVSAERGGAALVGALATLYLDAERYADAERLLAYAREKGHASSELQCVGGYLALANDEPKAAAERFQEVLRTRPSDGRALLGAGLSSAAEGDLAKASEYLHAASAAMPTHLGTLNALAWMQLLAGRLDDAAETLSRAQKVDDTFAETFGAQAIVAAMRGNAAETRTLVRTALRLDRECFSAAYAEMLLRHGSNKAEMLSSALDFLARQPAPGGGTMKDAVLRLGRVNLQGPARALGGGGRDR